MYKYCNCTETDAWWGSKIDQRIADRGLKKAHSCFHMSFFPSFVSLWSFSTAEAETGGLWQEGHRSLAYTLIHLLTLYLGTERQVRIYAVYISPILWIFMSPAVPCSVVFINEAFDLYEELSTKCLKTHHRRDQSADQKHTAKSPRHLDCPCQDLAGTEPNWGMVFILKTRMMGEFLQHTQILENDGRSSQVDSE